MVNEHVPVYIVTDRRNYEFFPKGCSSMEYKLAKMRHDRRSEMSSAWTRPRSVAVVAASESGWIEYGELFRLWLRGSDTSSQYPCPVSPGSWVWIRGVRGGCYGDQPIRIQASDVLWHHVSSFLIHTAPEDINSEEQITMNEEHIEEVTLSQIEQAHEDYAKAKNIALGAADYLQELIKQYNQQPREITINFVVEE